MTPVGRILLLSTPWVVVLVVALLLVALIQVLRLEPPWRRRSDTATPELSGLVGRTGRTLTPMRPVGMCEFNGQRVECVAENGYLQKDQSVRVRQVEGNKVTVEIVEGA